MNNAAQCLSKFDPGSFHGRELKKTRDATKMSGDLASAAAAVRSRQVSRIKSREATIDRKGLSLHSFINTIHTAQ